MRILVTGGAGYIGSHTVLQLLQAGHDVLVVDDLSNSSSEAVHRVNELAGRRAELVVTDVLDRDGLDAAFARLAPEAVIHFAGLKAVGESVQQPARYYTTNVGGTLSLLDVMSAHDCRTLVFSSSATVYGEPERVPMTEDMSTSGTNPYGWSKTMIERILTDVAASDERWRVALLRYFNPVGAHPSGRIGEDPQGIPNNLFPFVAQVAVGRRDEVVVFGDDYDTPDGTGLRDYLHVDDLAAGHLAALTHVGETAPGAHTWNLGTGTGRSVLEVVQAFREASGQPIPHRVAARRAGDIAASFADVSRARDQLGWTAARTLSDMCQDTWRWQQANPQGYGSD